MEASLLFSAVSAPFGVSVPTSNPTLLRSKLYAARKRDLASFADLSIILSPTNPSAELWIIKRKETPNDEA